MRQYVELCERVLRDGEQKPTRTGINTIGIAGAMMQFDLRQGFPVLTTKKVLFETVVDELIWFLHAGHNINDADAPKRIWDDWADATGDLGRIYGVQWRQWMSYRHHGLGALDDVYEVEPIDQLINAIQRVKKVPNSRRNLVSAWNVAELEEGLISFPPCHVLFQLLVMGEGTRLDMFMYQRSCDLALGVPFNIASYALLLTLIAHECGLQPGVFTHFLADAHVYVNHVETLKKQLAREPLPLPTLMLMNDKGGPLQPGFPVVQVRKENIGLVNYQHHGFLKYEVAV